MIPFTKVNHMTIFIYHYHVDHGTSPNIMLSYSSELNFIIFKLHLSNLSNSMYLNLISPLQLW
jgi:hypothetical protein